MMMLTWSSAKKLLYRVDFPTPFHSEAPKYCRFVLHGVAHFELVRVGVDGKMYATKES